MHCGVGRAERAHQAVARRLHYPPAQLDRGVLEQAQAAVHPHESLLVAQLLVQAGAAADVDEENGAGVRSAHRNLRISQNGGAVLVQPADQYKSRTVTLIDAAIRPRLVSAVYT